jgi:hypothetical protein
MFDSCRVAHAQGATSRIIHRLEYKNAQVVFGTIVAIVEITFVLQDSAERFLNTESRVAAQHCSEIGIRHATSKTFVGCQGLRFLKTWNLHT